MTGHNQARNQGDHQVGNHIRAHVPNRVHNRVQGRRNSRLLAGTRLYWVLASASLRAKMQYKFDFVTSTIIQALMGTYDFFLVAVILWKFREVAGWDIYEIGLLFAVSRVGYGFYRVFCNELEQFEGYIVRGDFDSILIRPWPSLFVLLSRSVDLSRLTWVVQGAKSYFVPVRKPGFLAGLRQVFSHETREIRAVDDISFRVPRGQFLGYIGPNGAGKSTTVKMLTGILHPTSGSVSINGLSPQKDRQRLAKQIGVVFGQRTQLWWDLPTADSFDILAAMYDVEPKDYEGFQKKFDDLMGIGEFLDVPVRRLSLGQRMRADLAAALLHRPSVLFLDEPTIGLDVVAKARIREFLRQLNKDQGVTILLTTHDLRDIEELCERVMVINHGSLVYDGNLPHLRDAAGLPTLLRVKYSALPLGLAAGEYLSPDGGRSASPRNSAWLVEAVDPVTRTVDVSFDRTLWQVPSVLMAMQALGEVRDVSLKEPLIEDIIRRLL